MEIRLSNRFTFLVIVTTVALGLFISLIRLYGNYSSAREHIELAVKDHLLATKATAAEAIFKLDKPIAQSLVNGTIANKYIVRSELYTEDGEILSSNSSPAPEDTWRPLGIANKTISYPISISELGDSDMGRHVIEVDYEAGLKAFYQRALRDSLVDFMLIMTVALVVYLISYLYIAKPVTKLSDEVAAIKPGDVPEKSELTERSDELGKLANDTYNYILKAHLFAEELKSRQTERLELEEKLRHSQKMDAIGQLAGGIAHDFNNIMTVILGNANLAQTYLARGFNERIERSLETIIQSSERAAKLTNQLLVFSRKDLSEPTAISMQQLITQSSKMLERLITEDISINYDLNEVHPIFADPNQIDLILINLTVNAKDAMPDGGSISINCANVMIDSEQKNPKFNITSGEYVLLRVKDTGCGIDQALQEKIFDPFFTTKPVGKGTGLGLSTVYGIITKWNGFIEISSVIDEGTTIDIYFPAVVDAQIKPTDILESDNRTYSFEGRVLICEDDQNVRNFIVDLLHMTDFEITSTESPLEAIQTYQNDPNFDLLITDIVMPDLNGKELSDKLNSIKPVQTVFVSGYSENVITEKGIITEKVKYIQKPFTQERLFEAIDEALKSA